jgi:gliding motility-associated-like protein
LVNPSQAGQYYRLRSQDNCGNWVQSNSTQTLVLQGRAQERFTNEIRWQAPNWSDGNVEEYEIYRIVGSDTQRLQNLDANTLRYEEQVNIRNLVEANICYFIRAWISLSLPNGSRRWVQTQSNLLCLDQDPTVQLPNAFAPDGQNRWFKPVVTFGRNLSQYSLRIYDRYGQLLFESNQWHQGWDGTHQGRPVPAGSYVYQLACTLPDGEQIFKQGNVQLLR